MQYNNYQDAAEGSAISFVPTPEQLQANQAHYKQPRASDPIGVFDTGAGGLTILSALRKELPHESYIYIGDTANCPYGVRSDAEVIELTSQACRFLIEKQVKLIVIACNTASQAALAALRASFDLSFIGVVPAVKPATRLTRKGKIGIIATNQSASSTYLRQLIDEFAGGIQVYAEGCPNLVTLVEAGKLDGPEATAEVQEAIRPLISQGVDVLVLGCTHFPALRPVIQEQAGPGVTVIDSGDAIARRTRSVLETENLMTPVPSENASEGALEVWCSGDAQDFSRVASKVLGYDVMVKQAVEIPQMK
jgi:glutamate racemase